MRRAIVVFLALGAILGLTAAYAVEREPDWYVRLRYPLAYENLVRGYAKMYHLDPALVAAVIYSESKFDHAARSRAGAVGLMQLTPSTAQAIADATGGRNYSPEDLLSPDINVRYGCFYLQRLKQRYRRWPNSLDLALAAYNAGPGKVDSWIRNRPAGQPVQIRFAETRAYIAKVRHLRDLYDRAYGL